MEKKLVYFLCTGNSCRSQMADGFLQAVGRDKFEVKSAGLEAHGLNPRAVQVMKEAGVDISAHTSNVIDPEILNRAMYVITLCGHADEHCPVISNPNVVKWHWGFDDPAKAEGTEEVIMSQFRAVRDAIKARVELFVKEQQPVNYNDLIPGRIFMGGAADVEQMVQNEACEVIVDLREEATESAYPKAGVEWVHIPIGDNSVIPQEQLFQEAIDQVVAAYRDGKKVGFHCGGGKGRTGAVAIGTLIELGKAGTLEEAEAMAQSLRSVIKIRDPQRQALDKIYKKNS